MNKKENLQSKNKSIVIIHHGQSVRLSGRQKECLLFLINGKTAKEIGRTLCISYRTVESYFEELKRKLHCQSRREIIQKILANENTKNWFFEQIQG